MRTLDQRATGVVWRGDLGASRQKKVGFPVWQRKEVIQTGIQRLESEGVKVPMTTLCQWSEVPPGARYITDT